MDREKNQFFEKVEIGLASPKQIREWSERCLPTGEKIGEVTSWETVNYKTLKPEPNGLFCEKIFGPIIDFTCACGKKPTKGGRGFCSKCGVERTHSRVRRYRLGYIKLKQPVVHTVYATQRPSPLRLCLGWSNKRMQHVMYGTEFCHLPAPWSIFCSNQDFIQISRSRELLLKKKAFQESRDKNSQNQTASQSPPKSEKNPQQITQSRVGRHSVKSCSNLKPRLFAVKKNFPSKFLNHGYPPILLNLSLHLYGVAFTITWRHIEDLQQFLFFIWEQSFSYEFSIPYYHITKVSDKKPYQLPFHTPYYPIQTGGMVFRTLLAHYDLLGFQQQLQLHYQELKKIIYSLQEKFLLWGDWNPEDKEKKSLFKKLKRLKELEKKCLRRIHYFRDFYKHQLQPEWMVLSYLPVLPPGLRPIMSIGGELIVSDINSLYRKVIIRNKRMISGATFGIFDTVLSGSWAAWCYNLRQLQEAVDALLKTGNLYSGKTTKSLLDTLKGKKGRFRQHLLGKRVDYSGRSVIVVGPQLQIHECGLPRQMAIELFQPFIIQKLRRKGIVCTTTAAKALIADRKPIVWSVLREILKNHPVLLNRAPTLHRLGIQAFLPQLVEGKAILLHPLVCPGFNADFDGDQMAVHVPLSILARSEALNLLWSRNQLVAPASGQPLLLPTQDMVLGFYYLTCSKDLPFKGLEHLVSSRKALLLNKTFLKSNTNLYFSELSQVRNTFDRGFLKLHTPVWLKWSGLLQSFLNEYQAQLKENLLETRVDQSGHIESVFIDKCQFSNFLSSTRKNSNYLRTTPGRIFMHSCIYPV